MHNSKHIRLNVFSLSISYRYLAVGMNLGSSFRLFSITAMKVFFFSVWRALTNSAAWYSWIDLCKKTYLSYPSFCIKHVISIKSYAMSSAILLSFPIILSDWFVYSISEWWVKSNLLSNSDLKHNAQKHSKASVGFSDALRSLLKFFILSCLKYNVVNNFE